MKYIKPIIKNLIEYGFVLNGGVYEYTDYNEELNMTLRVCVNQEGDFNAQICDCDTEDIYTLHLVDDAAGEFVGKVRAYYERVIKDITNNCFDSTVFMDRQTEEVISYVKEKYGGEAEYLWEDTPDCCIVRRQDNRKWYLVIMTVDGSKLGIEAGEKEIIDLRCGEEELNRIVDGERYFRGWHMNKRLWLTLILDGRVAIEEIKSRLDKSYALAGNRPSKRGS